MKRLITATLGFSGLAAVVVSLGLLAVMNFDYIPGRYPGAMRIVRERFSLLSVDKGYVSQAGVYQTDAEVMNVWRWYARQFNVEPESGMNPEGQCVRLTKAKQHIFIRHTVEVRLCSVAHGTLVFFNQTVYLRP